MGGGVWIDHAHNLWLDTAFEVGIPGALILTGLLLCGLVTGIQRARHAVDRDDPAVWAGLAGSLAAFAVHGLFMFSTIVPTTLFWLIVGVVARPVASGTAPETDERRPAPATI